MGTPAQMGKSPQAATPPQAAESPRAIQPLESGPSDGRALQRLLDELGRLPGIGPKSAQRIAYWILESDAETARRLSVAITQVKQEVHFCPVCFSYAVRKTCDICADSSRDKGCLCEIGRAHV